MSATEQGLNMAAAKRKFPRADAIAAAKDLVAHLNPHCARLVVAGSLRRRKQSVGDIEILYIPQFASARDGLFDTKQIDLAEAELQRLLGGGTIRKRPTASPGGRPPRESWGPKNKHGVHVASGIPVDFFLARSSNWWNYLVCRTGGAQNNIEISSAAQRKGWKWHPYSEGFTDRYGLTVPAASEREVFELAGLKYLEPWERS